MSSWLEELLDGTADVETPKKFIFWSGLATISAVVKNNVWIRRYPHSTDTEREAYKLFPNLYVLLIAPSGHRKGYAVAIAKELAELAGDVRVISGRNSIQGIIQDLGNARTSPKGGPPRVDSTAFIVSGEWSTSLVRDPDALTILTDLYDGQYNKVWKNTLKHSGVEKLVGVNITMLGGLNETHFHDMITDKEMEGGFIARCMLIQSKQRERKNLGLRPTNRVLDLPKLAGYLKELKKLKGPFKVENDAIEYMEEWYNNEWEPEHSGDKTGLAMRVHDHILKVAELLSLSRRPELVVEKQDLVLAKTISLEMMSRADTVTKGAGMSEYARKTKVFIEALLRAPGHKLSRRRLLSRCYGDIDANDLKRIEETLAQAEIIFLPYMGSDGGKTDQIYELTPDTVKEYVEKEKK